MVVAGVMVRGVKFPMWPVGMSAHSVFVERAWARRTRVGSSRGMGWRLAAILSTPTR